MTIQRNLARPITRLEQEEMGLIRVTDHTGTRFIPPAPQDRPRVIPAQIGDPYAAFANVMDEARTVYTADPITRGVALLLKTSAITLFLSLLTLAALVLLENLTFFLWLLLASVEWVCCFLYLAYNDWREHPSAIRWRLTEGYLYLMEREQSARIKALYGVDPKELGG